MDRELRDALGRIEDRIEGSRVDAASDTKRVEDKVDLQNGRLRTVELWKARTEGMFVGWRVLPVLAALGATGAAWVAVLR